MHREYRFSENINCIGRSPIRESFKYMGKPGIISLSSGNPDAATFPAAELKEISDYIYENMSGLALQYNLSEGYTPLREKVADRLKNRFGIDTDNNQTCITTGGQQAIDLIAKILIDPGDTVICEKPSFIGALNSFRAYGANLKGVEMDDEGIIPEGLEEILKNDRRVSFIYVIPTFQNPSGKTMSAQRRKEIYELAKKYDTLILEDNPYGELRFSGEDILPIKAMDDEGLVMYVGSFSKILSPGIRMGFICAPEPIVNKMMLGKQTSDSHTNIFFQVAADLYMQKYDLDEHIAEVAGLYKEKCDAMIAAIEKYFPSGVSHTTPEGGMFLWCTVPDSVDVPEFIRLAAEKYKVICITGAAFLPDAGEVPHSFRLNYSNPSIEDINEGIYRLSQALEEALGNSSR